MDKIFSIHGLKSPGQLRQTLQAFGLPWVPCLLLFPLFCNSLYSQKAASFSDMKTDHPFLQVLASAPLLDAPCLPFSTG